MTKPFHFITHEQYEQVCAAVAKAGAEWHRGVASLSEQLKNLRPLSGRSDETETP
ncbi:hypothetical protein [Nocardia abscessus]|uniref:hypothetical protein n=1 Tax=Nocardia abscessus TaxID=120957 RepID=UPI002455384C|nr:hypothetical protein [Nocardia abscessus]